MDYGVLGAYFDGAVAKTLAGVDIMGANKSHQFSSVVAGFLHVARGIEHMREKNVAIRCPLSSCSRVARA